MHLVLVSTSYKGSFLRSARMFDRKQTVGMGCPWADDMFAQKQVRMMRGKDTLVVTNVANKNDRHTFAESSSPGNASRIYVFK